MIKFQRDGDTYETEEPDIDVFIENPERMYPNIEYVNRLMTHSWEQRVIRFYDLDGNLIEVGTPMESLDSNLQG